MIKPTEFRIGNLFHGGDYVRRVTRIDYDGVMSEPLNYIGERFVEYVVSPIELTDEWFTRLGFNSEESERWCEKHSEFEPTTKFHRSLMCFYYDPEQGCYVDEQFIVFGLKLEFVHQLQNFAFALTSEELEYNKEGL